MKQLSHITTLALILVSLATPHSGFTQIFEEDPLGRDLDPDLRTLTTAVPFLLIAPDSRSGAMGDVGVAFSPSAYSLYWNVGAMAFLETQEEWSLSYSPWLRALVDDMDLSYLSRVRKLNPSQAIGYSFRYFSLGQITFTDEYASEIMDFQPNEFCVTAGFSQKFGPKFSGGFSGKFIYSNLLGGVQVGGADSQPGVSVASDIGLYYTNPRANWGRSSGTFSLGMTLSNLGAKISYTETAARDFIPSNLRIGSCYQFQFDEYNSLALGFDMNKLLVPSPPLIDAGTGEIISGMNPDVGVAQGIVQSFYDAAGIFYEPTNGDEPFIVSGSRFREEMAEINLGLGLEYNFNQSFDFRTGYFYEPYSKGNRQWVALGFGLKYSTMKFDMSYLVSTTQAHPLANTLRFSVSLQFSDLAEFAQDGE